MTSYHGKDWDNTAAALAMAVGREEIAHAAVLTGRAFACVNREPGPFAWLVPAMRPAEALVSAVRLLAGDARTLSLEPPSDEVLLSLARTLLRESAVVVGPAITPLFASRPASHFSGVAAHFLVIHESSRDGTWVVHDPEGCPFLRMTGDDLATALRDAEVVVGVTPTATWDTEAVLRTAWTRGIALRRACRSSANGAALREVAGCVTTGLRGSDVAALQASLPALSVARAQLSTAARTLGFHVAAEILVEAVSSAATCIAAVTDRDQKALVVALRAAAAVEDAFDDKVTP